MTMTLQSRLFLSITKWFIVNWLFITSMALQSRLLCIAKKTLQILSPYFANWQSLYRIFCLGLFLISQHSFCFISAKNFFALMMLDPIKAWSLYWIFCLNLCMLHHKVAIALQSRLLILGNRMSCVIIVLVLELSSASWLTINVVGIVRRFWSL